MAVRLFGKSSVLRALFVLRCLLEVFFFVLTVSAVCLSGDALTLALALSAVCFCGGIFWLLYEYL